MSSRGLYFTIFLKTKVLYIYISNILNSRNFLKLKVGRDPSPGTQAYVAGWGALIPEDVTG